MPNDMIFGVNLIPKNDNEESLGNSNKKWIAYLDSINGQTAETVLLPTVTSSNNGNVLMVSNGAWNTSPMDTLTRQFWTSQTTVSVPLSANGKSYLIWSAGTSNGTSGALMDSTYGSLTFVSNG